VLGLRLGDHDLGDLVPIFFKPVHVSPFRFCFGSDPQIPAYPG
jgi:hypothetical protein